MQPGAGRAANLARLLQRMLWLDAYEVLRGLDGELVLDEDFDQVYDESLAEFGPVVTEVVLRKTGNHKSPLRLPGMP